MPSLLFLAITISILQLSTSLPEPEVGGSVHKPPVFNLGNLPGQLANLFLWSMDNFDKKMAAEDRYDLEFAPARIAAPACPPSRCTQACGCRSGTSCSKRMSP